MRNEGEIKTSAIDWWLILIYLVLLVIGYLNIYSSGFNEKHTAFYDFHTNYGRQFWWILSSLLIAGAIIITDARFFPRVSGGFYVAVMILLFIVLALGTVVSGSKSWIDLGAGIRLQPSEFAKFATALVLAKTLSDPNTQFTNPKIMRRSLLLVFIPIALVLLQRDTGSAIVFTSFILLFYRLGLPGFYLFFIFLMGLLFVLALLIKQFYLILYIIIISLFLFYWFREHRKKLFKVLRTAAFAIVFVFSVNYIFNNVLLTHQKDRINVLIGKKYDPKGVAWNVTQSLIAIGSGGLSGKGFMNGTQTRYNYVPEQSTDFIFCTIGEEWGFIGSSFVVIIYVLLFIRLVMIAERQKAAFTRVYAYGIAGILFTHFFVNIGMALGLLPVIGIPLPYLSYGGSSLWAFTMMLFVLIKLDAHRKELF